MDMDFWEEQCVGHAPPDIIRKQRKPDAALSVEEMVEVRTRLFEDAIERGELPLTGGAIELLEQLRDEGVRCAVVTSGPRGYIEKALAKLGIADCFEVVVTGTDEALQGRLKPQPFPYLHAAQLMGVQPAECLAFEDVRHNDLSPPTLTSHPHPHLSPPTRNSDPHPAECLAFEGVCVPLR